jgi:hypothetical protein
MTTEHTVVSFRQIKKKAVLIIETFASSYPRVSSDIPSFAAFTPVAPGVRFNALAILLTPIFCFASGLTLTLPSLA